MNETTKSWRCAENGMDRLCSPVVVGYALLFLVVVTPTTYSPVKALLLALALGGLAVRFVRSGRLGVHPSVLLRTLLFSAAGLFFVLVGSLRGNPGAFAMAPVFVAWPIVYTLLMGGLDDRGRLDRVVQLLVVATFTIEAAMYSFLLHAAGLLPVSFTSHLELGQAVAGDFREFNFFSIASLIFLVPFLVGALVIWPRSPAMPLRRKPLWVAALLAAPLVLLSGRRGLWIAVGIAPLVAVVFRAWLRGRQPDGLVPWRRLLVRAVPIALVSLGVVTATTGLSAGDVWATLRQGFDFSTGDAGLGRAVQYRALVEGWMESPLFGKGLGAVAPDVIRSHEQPWSYELVYVALLFTTGIVGVVIYVYGGVWVVRQARAMTRSGDPNSPVLLSILVGTIGILVASGTNQYLTKFDGLWPLFLPIAFINEWLLSGRRDGDGDEGVPAASGAALADLSSRSAN